MFRKHGSRTVHKKSIWMHRPTGAVRKGNTLQWGRCAAEVFANKFAPVWCCHVGLWWKENLLWWSVWGGEVGWAGQWRDDSESGGGVAMFNGFSLRRPSSRPPSPGSCSAALLQLSLRNCCRCFCHINLSYPPRKPRSNKTIQRGPQRAENSNTERAKVQRGFVVVFLVCLLEENEKCDVLSQLLCVLFVFCFFFERRWRQGGMSENTHSSVLLWCQNGL